MKQSSFCPGKPFFFLIQDQGCYRLKQNNNDNRNKMILFFEWFVCYSFPFNHDDDEDKNQSNEFISVSHSM